MRAPEFFAFARKRHQIYLDRAAGRDRPWTDDPILDTYRFTNVFRELDRTTIWFVRHVRGNLAAHGQFEQVLGTILFRTFNRVETAEQIFCQRRLDVRGGLPIGWSYLREETTVDELEAYMRANCPTPWVTGAYIVKTPDGMDKLAGALWIVEEARKRLPDILCGGRRLSAPETLQTFWEALVRFPYIGGFTAYEIVTDLRHLPILRDATDIMSWANAGPGAVRGLNRIHGRPVAQSLNQLQANREMRDLLEIARVDYTAWPEHGSGWPEWEMREVEHTLCEFDKYERVRLGEGTPRGRFR